MPYVMISDFNQALSAGGKGALFGGGLGLMTGGLSGYKYAKDNGLNPWGETKIYRAVDDFELSVIKETKSFSLQEGGLESKYFAKTKQDAHWYGKGLYLEGYKVIEGVTPINIKKYWYPNVDIGAYNISKEILPYIKPKFKK